MLIVPCVFFSCAPTNLFFGLMFHVKHFLLMLSFSFVAVLCIAHSCLQLILNVVFFSMMTIVPIKSLVVRSLHLFFCYVSRETFICPFCFFYVFYCKSSYLTAYS